MIKDVILLRDTAEGHRIKYNNIVIQTSLYEYWQGRRDEAGYFRDRLDWICKTNLEEIELPAERLEILNYL